MSRAKKDAVKDLNKMPKMEVGKSISSKMPKMDLKKPTIKKMVNAATTMKKTNRKKG